MKNGRRYSNLKWHRYDDTRYETKEEARNVIETNRLFEKYAEAGVLRAKDDKYLILLATLKTDIAE